EQYGEELALHASRELGSFLVTPVKIRARFLGVRKNAEARIFGIDRDRFLDAGSACIHARRPLSRSARRRGNSGGGSPPGVRTICSDLKFSGPSASDSGVSSMQIGRMKTPPSAMLRARSTA